MKSTITVVSLLAIITSTNLGCQKKHRPAIEIYTSGEIGDTLDWVIHYNFAKWQYDTFYYKYDTSLCFVSSFWDSTGKDKAVTNFYYNHKAEGVITVYYRGGAKLSKAFYKNGLKDGFDISYYESGKIRWKVFYDKDKPIYSVTYNEQGEKIDSSSLANLKLPTGVRK